MKKKFPSNVLMTLFCFFVFCCAGSAGAVEFYISPMGDDMAVGSKMAPFKTISRGLTELRETRKKNPNSEAILSLQGGIYQLESPLVLGKDDSELTLRAASKDDPPRLIGGRVVSEFTPLTDPVVREILPATVVNQVLVADIKTLSNENYGQIKSVGFTQNGTSPMELFVDGRVATLARYPNSGWLEIASIPAGQRGKTITTKLEKTRLSRWKKEGDPWLYGYWCHGWSDKWLPVKEINVSNGVITMDQIDGYGLREGQRFFARNMLSELDVPGEYYIDREKGKIYLYKPKDPHFEAMVSTFESSIIQIAGAKGIELNGLSIEVGRSNGVTVKNCDNVRVLACRVRNVGQAGIQVDGGQNCKVDNCEVSATGTSGVIIDGGDRKTLTAGSHIASNNLIHHVSRIQRTYNPGIKVSGVSNHVRNNELHHMPHQAILFDGNDHSIELNEIHHVVLETDDSGAIYTCPRDFTSRGTVIRHNYIYQSGPEFAPSVKPLSPAEEHVVQKPMHLQGTSLIYLDDLTGGMTVEGNILVGSYRAILIGGGRDNLITNNLIIGGNIGIWIDARGLGWAEKFVDKGGSFGLYRKFAAMNGDKLPYIKRYPALADVLTNHPKAPVNTVASSNIILGAKLWKKTEEKSDAYIKFTNNYALNSDFSTTENPRTALQSVSSSEIKRIGFKPIPFDQIGRNQRSELVD